MTSDQPLGRPLASGREADVYAPAGRRVLRRYRRGEDAAPEAEVVGYARAHGYPVPEVFAARGTDLVMERVDGPTLAEAMMAGTMTVTEGAATMAELLRRPRRPA